MANAATVMEKITKSVQHVQLDAYLFLPDRPFPDLPSFIANYTIYLPPMNSSGDIYHIITYLMLAKSENKKLPIVQLTYDGRETEESQEDKMNPFSQTLRCIQFVEHLGFKEQFTEPIALKGDGFRQNVRCKKMQDHIKFLSNEEKNMCYVDQKLLTTIISHYFIEYGREKTVEILTESYKKWSVNEDINQKIRQSVEQQINHMPTEKPLIILQIRYSSKANNDQNIDPLIILLQLVEYFKSKGFSIWYLFVDSRVRKPLIIGRLQNKTNCFPHKIDSIDYGKLFHLEFLLQSLKMENLRGIVGNTSGCLDLAAMIGHNAVNLHQFHGQFDYQSYRIFLQSSFLRIENFNKDAIKNVILDEEKKQWIKFNNKTMGRTMPILYKWIEQSGNGSMFPVQLLNNVQQTNLEAKRLAELHHIITYQDGKLKTTSIPIFKGLITKLSREVKDSEKSN
jgi:hypothetical protein